MSDIDDWLRAHEGELDDIARETDVASALVRLAAVLILAGIEDAQIEGQLHSLVSLHDQRYPLAGAPRALEEIHRLATERP
jgi:hypothetical protein